MKLFKTILMTIVASSVVVVAQSVDSAQIIKDKYAEIEAAENAAKDANRTALAAQGRGGAGGIYTGILGYDMIPVKNLIARREVAEASMGFPDSNSIEISGYRFNEQIEEREAIGMFGGIGYAGIGKGMRIGGTLQGGLKHYASTLNGNTVDLAIAVGQTAFLFDKSFEMKKSRFLIGAQVGFGGVGAVFYEDTTSGDFEDNYYEFEGSTMYAVAYYSLFEFHGGYSYQFTKIFQMGLEFTGQTNHSVNGFSGSDGYTTFNPGGNLRFVWGRI